MPIKNIASISSRYSPTNMFPIPGTSQSYFNNFAIRLEDYTPEEAAKVYNKKALELRKDMAILNII